MRNLWLVFFAISLTACSSISDTFTGFFESKDNAEPPAQLTDFTARAELDTAWEVSAGESSSKLYVLLLPAISDGKIFAAGVTGRVNAFDAKTGAEQWQVDTNVPVRGGPGVGEGLVLIGTADAEVIALSQKDGSELWRSRVSSEVLASPRVGSGVVVARSIDGRIYGLNAADGKRLWIYDSEVPVLTLRGMSAAVINGRGVVAGLANGRLVALSLIDGLVLWESSIAEPRGRSELDRIVDIDSEPVIANGVVHAVTFQGNIATIALENGRGVWRREMSSFAGLSADANYLYVTDEKSHIWALDRRNGQSYWKQAGLQSRHVTAPTAYGDYVIVGDLEGYVHVLSRKDGGFVARKKVSSGAIIAAPLVEGDIIYVNGADGRLTALRLRAL